MRLTVLVNDYGTNKNLINAHGFSVLIEDTKTSLLFDAGLNDEIVKNASYMKKDLSEISCIIISHSHYDHTGGLRYLGNIIKPDVKLYISQNFSSEKYKRIDGKYKFIGLDINDIPASVIMHPITENLLIKNKFFMTHIKKEKNYKEDYFFIKNDNSEFVPDYFDDEIVLSIIEDDGVVVITGCSHSGLKNILETIKGIYGDIKIKLLLGGFHLSKVSDENILSVSKDLKNFDIERIGVYHCSGKRAYEIFKKELKNVDVFWGETGDKINI